MPGGWAGARTLLENSAQCGSARARYVLVSTLRFPRVAEQLDTGTILALKGLADGWASPPGSAGDYMSLTMEARTAQPRLIAHTPRCSRGFVH
jgi:hypothetical protein